ncbi:MAG: ATP-binding protein [Acidiferrobacterales bacterium]
MHSLFWKIFLSFWIALILFSAATMFAASHFVDRLRQQQEAIPLHERMLEDVVQGQRVADRSGLAGLKRWLHRLDRHELVPMLLVDRNNTDLLGRPLPEGVLKRLARRSVHAPLPPIILPDHRSYVLIPDFQAVTLARLLVRPHIIMLPIVLAAVMSGLVCLVLARYLTAPIGRLRRATEAYASGQLNERVAPTLGRRKDEIADFARAFDQMAQHLQELMASQRQLLSDVSHELRSPLARLQVALGLARQRTVGRAAPEFDRIELEAERLNDLIGQLLSLARLEAGVALPQKETVDLAELLAAVAADADFEGRSRNRAVVVVRTSTAVLRGHTGLLRSALENIVRNALRYTAEGTTVEISLDRHGNHGDWLEIGIHDHGPGVPEKFLPLLFEPFVRVNDARDRSSGGYGLGLAIAKRAIGVHGGTVAAFNDSGNGLRVVVRIPVQAPMAMPQPLATGTP